MNTETARKLRAIATEIRDHSDHWTQGVLARSAKGRCVDPNGRTAVCWCAYGFLMRDFKGDYQRAFKALTGATGTYRFARLNDHPSTTPQRVAGWFDKAADLLEAEA